MKGAYLKYFVFLASNWNARVAAHIIKHEAEGERKYKLKTTGADELRSLERKGIDISNATLYMPACYDVLQEVFNRVWPNKKSHFVDIGCGKGRVMAVAAHHRFTKISGVDFSPALCKAAEKNMEITKEIFPDIQYNIEVNDAFFYTIPTDADFIFMFNPFNEIIMSGVANNIIDSYRKKPRKITLIYLNSLYNHLFVNLGFKQVWQMQKMKYLEAKIFELT